MILRTSAPSPFGRKVKLAAKVLGLSHLIKLQAADPTDPQDSLRAQNPLGKIPTLVLDDGTVLFDSRVIVEYLDHLAGGDRIIPAGAERFGVLRLQALADGIMDAAILQIYEVRFRDEPQRNAAWLANQSSKVARGLAALEASPPALTNPPDIGAIAVACALGYLDLRFHGTWRAAHPRLVAWLDQFAAQVKGFEETGVVT
jgi:glutathione S-transferase